MEQRDEEAREAYSSAMMLASRGGQGQMNMAVLQQKLQSLSQQAPRELPEANAPQADAALESATDEENTEN